MAKKNNKEQEDRQQELAVLAAAGDRRARDDLIVSLMTLAGVLARRRTLSNPGHREDAEQAAIEGIIYAVDKFDPARGLHIGKFAGFCADRRISRYLAEMLGPASVPVNAAGRRGATIAASMISVRIDPAAADTDDQDAGIDLPDPTPGADEVIIARVRDDALRAAILHLRGQERVVIEGRLAGKMLSTIGAELGISHERTRQISVKACARLKKIMIAMQITGRK
ncbi:sigma-70 family RNA polymerase sigma factor [Shumkonia mesophila]|uniref:sigma-70 family RNA polymerase sigma factor n=1 Tax=Shumkonia mesophila TaxID=2838854 RepID=UPI002934D3C4|nr:sigma-70 family RNA polymerase sigma factor [Shumkonia mesophila]